MSLPGADPTDRAGVRTTTRLRAFARRMQAFTLPELAIALAIFAILLSMAIPSYQSYRQQVNVTIAMRDIGRIYSRVESYIALYSVPPPTV